VRVAPRATPAKPPAAKGKATARGKAAKKR